MTSNELERFWPKVRVTPFGCWVWTAYRNSGGYGQFSVDGTGKRAHRVAYEHFVGSIPEGLQIDHICRRRECVNPAHMEPVTNRENSLRGVSFSAKNARKTHCKHGHEFSKANTMIFRRKPSGIHRMCRVCDLRSNRKCYRARKAAALVGT
jgi:hypothetical protein